MQQLILMKKPLFLLVSVFFFALLLPSVFCATPARTFFNGLGDLAGINAVGGSIDGAYSFVAGVKANAIRLENQAAVNFPNVGGLKNSGTIEFWVKPEFDIKKMGRGGSSGLFEVGNFPYLSTFGVWAYNSEWGPVVILEVKDSEGNYKQAWSKVTSFKPNKWHHVAIVWKCNQKKSGDNYARVYVDGEAGSKQTKLCKSIDLAGNGIQIGTLGYYQGNTKTMDNLEVFDGVKSSDAIKSDYKKLKPK